MANAASPGFEFLSMQFVLYAARAQKYELITAEQRWYYPPISQPNTDNKTP
jgi:hypothetical protein